VFYAGATVSLRDVDAGAGTRVVVKISGDFGGKWLLAREATRWDLVKNSGGTFASRITTPQDLAWRLFAKGIDRDSARAQVEIYGDQDLGEKVLYLTAIVA